jgi:hypothetical protein
MTDPPEPTLTDYCATVDRMIAAMETVLETGRAAQRRVENYCRARGIDLDAAAPALTAESIPPQQRHMNRVLLQAIEDCKRPQLLSSASPTAAAPRPLLAASTASEPSTAQSRPSIASRALSHRHRI